MGLFFNTESNAGAVNFVKFGTGHDFDDWADALVYLENNGGHTQIGRTPKNIAGFEYLDKNWNRVLRQKGRFRNLDAIIVSEGIVLPSSDIQSKIYDYVDNGGCLIVTGDHADNEDDFLNDIFGYSITVNSDSSEDETITIQAGASGTAFAGGPSPLAYLDLTTFFGSTPGSTIYADSTDVLVFLANVGSGSVMALGWDYCCFGTTQQKENWFEVMRRALEQCP